MSKASRLCQANLIKTFLPPMQMVYSTVESYIILLTPKMKHPFSNPVGNSSNNASKVSVTWSLISYNKIYIVRNT